MDLLDALMAAQQQQRPGTPGSTSAFSDAPSPFPVTPKPQSKLQKLLPLIHVISVWCLFVFFVVWREPTVHSENSPWHSEENSFWARWARLSPQSSRASGEAWQVQPVVCLYHVLVSVSTLTLPQPFWGALATLELVLFSFRVFSGFVRCFSRKLLPVCLTQIPGSDIPAHNIVDGPASTSTIVTIRRVKRAAILPDVRGPDG